jgi:long-chain fatty acid transport protein
MDKLYSKKDDTMVPFFHSYARRSRQQAALFLFAAVLGAFAPSGRVWASGLESKGLGSRARGMGFAMIALADDWTAVHFNPAGLARAPEHQFGCEYEFFTGSIDSTASLRNLPPETANAYRGDLVDFIGDEPRSFGEKSVDSDIHFGALGFLRKTERFTWGFGMYGSGSGTAWEDTLLTGIGDTVDAEIAFTNGSMNMPLSFAWRAGPRLDLGATLGIHWGLLTVENKKVRSGNVPYVSETVQDTQGFGLGLDLGIRWKANDRLDLGAVVKLPYTFRKKGDTEITQSLYPLRAESNTTVDMDYPLRIGLGAAFTPVPGRVIALSLTWHDWSEYRQSTDYDDEIPGIFEDSSGNPGNWEDAWVVNLGYEHRQSERWTLRCGLVYDQAPEPEEARTLVGGQVVDVWLFSAGAGLALEDSRLDFGYIHTYGPGVDGFVPGAEYSMSLHEIFVGWVKNY